MCRQNLRCPEESMQHTPATLQDVVATLLGTDPADVHPGEGSYAYTGPWRGGLYWLTPGRLSPGSRPQRKLD